MLSSAKEFIFDLGESMVVLREHSQKNEMEVFCLGNSYSLIHHIIELCEVQFPLCTHFQVRHVFFNGIVNYMNLCLYNLAHNIVNSKSLILKSDVRAELTTLILGMPSIEENAFIVCLSNYCLYSNFAFLSSPELTAKYPVADRGELFSRQVYSRWVVGEIKTQFVTIMQILHQYTIQDTCLLYEDFLFGLLNYLLFRRDLVKSIYFMKDEGEKLRITNIINQPKFKKQGVREQFVSKQRDIMLSLFPAVH